MKTTKKTELLRVVGILLLFFSTSGAQAEKIKLLCNVDVETDYPTGQSKGPGPFDSLIKSARPFNLVAVL